MATVTIQEAQGRIFELIRQLKPGDEVVITDKGRPVPRLIGARQPRKAGSAKGVLTINLDDDEHLEDFKDYMP